MAQHDMVIDNGPGLAVRTDINAALQALVSQSSGPTEPTTMYAGMIWRDTSVSPPVTRVRDQGNTAWTTPLAVTNVSGTAPVVSSGGVTPAISMAAATTSVPGYLTAADWNTFNNKATTAQLGNYLPLSGGTLTGNITANGFVASSNATAVYGNLVNKNGRSGGFSANICDFIWDGAGILLWVDDSNLGRISTTSDYRIKKDVAPLGSTWEQVKALRPISYTQAEFMPPMSDERAAAARVLAGSEPKSVDEPLFKNDDTPQWGFIAHELQETLLQTAATGVKDMEDGVQTPNWPPVVAALTKALQEAMQRIEALEAAAP